MTDQPRRPHRSYDPLIAILVGLIGAGCGLLPPFRVIWAPDEFGLLSLQARNVLAGKLVHRDFVEVYSGLLTYFNAALFSMLGTNFASLQTGMMLCTFLLCSTCFLILRRFYATGPSALLTVIILVMGPLNYYAPLPTWFNLAFTVVALLFALKFRETGLYRHALLAGIAIGVSAAIKITGVLVLPVLALMLASSSPGSKRLNVASGWGIAGCSATGVLAFILLAKFDSPIAWAFIGGPIGASLMLMGRRLGRTSVLEVYAPAALVAGVLLVIAPLVGALAALGGLDAFLERTFAANLSRFQLATAAPLTRWSDVWLALFCFAGMGAAAASARRSTAWTLGAVAVLVVASFLPNDRYPLYWLLAGTVLSRLVFGSGPRGESKEAYEADLILFSAAIFGLVMLPFATTTYLHYQMPLVLLALMTQSRVWSPAMGRMSGLPLVLLVGVALLFRPQTALGFFLSWGFNHHDYVQVPLPGTADMLFRRSAAESLVGVSQVLAGKLKPSDQVYFGPEISHLTFLLPYRNIASAPYRFMEPPGFEGALTAALERGELSAVVRPRRPVFSPPDLDSKLLGSAFSQVETFPELELFLSPRPAAVPSSERRDAE